MYNIVKYRQNLNNFYNIWQNRVNLFINYENEARIAYGIGRNIAL